MNDKYLEKYQEDINQDRQTFLGDDEWSAIERDAEEHEEDTKNIIKWIIINVLKVVIALLVIIIAIYSL